MASKIARIYWFTFAIIMLTACGGDPLNDNINRQQQLTKEQDRGQIREAVAQPAKRLTATDPNGPQVDSM